MARNGLDRSIFFALVLGAALWMISGVVHAAKRQTADEAAFTDVDLQLELMSYADRYAAVLAQAIDDVERLGPPPETRRAIVADVVFSAAAAFTIAADPEPQLGLLDMVVMTTLGRTVYEDYWRPQLGDATLPVIAAFTKLEADVWKVASPILDAEQQRELRERITVFHRDNPELSTFSHLRFGDFPSRREASSLRKQKSGGIFASVRRVSSEVEQTRILAERAMYVATRLPLLTGGFADVWTSRLLANPAAVEIRTDAHRLSLASDRLTAVAEQLPEQIAAVRKDTFDELYVQASAIRYEAIEHAMKSIATEREQIFRQITDEEEGVGILLTDLRQTLTEANTLVASTDTLAQRFVTEEPARPFDIEDYRKTIADAGAVVQDLNVLVQSANELLSSPGAEDLTPALTGAVGAAGRLGEDLVDYTLWRAALLILLALAGYVIARLGYRWLATRMFGGAT